MRQLQISCCWVCLGLIWVLGSPWTGVSLLGRMLDFLFLGVTAGLIPLTAWLAFREYRAKRSITIDSPSNVAHFILVPLLLIQIAYHLGTHHFVFDEAPDWWDWGTFTMVHAVRAGDLVDTFHAFDLHLQSIQHRSMLTTSLLLYFHIMLDLMLLGMISRGVLYWLWDFAEENMYLVGLIVVLFIILFPISAFWENWGIDQSLLWCVDNALRVLDFPDIMQLFGWQLHTVPVTAWNGFLSITFRLLVTITLIRFLTGEYRSHHSPKKLEKPIDGEGELTWLPDLGWRPVGACLGCLLLVAFICGNWQGQIEKLSRIASTPDDPMAVAAARSLSRLGPHAANQSGKLYAALPNLPDQQQAEIRDTLERLK